jgi:hypothetical protein
MLAKLYANLEIPDNALLGKRIYKKMFMEHGKLSTADKRALSEDVTSIVWKYTLKASTVQIHPFEDEERRYLEVAIIEVNLSRPDRSARITQVIQQVIPHPALLILVDGESIALNVAHKRFSLAEKGAVVVQDTLTTPWMSEATTAVNKALLGSLSLRSLSHQHFYALYQDLYLRLLARNAADLTGSFTLTQASEKEQRARLGAIREMDRTISSHKAAIKKAQEFAEQVELNTQIKALEAKRNQAIAELQA